MIADRLLGRTRTNALRAIAANNLVGWIGGLLEKMPGTHFWLLHAALSGIAGLFLIASRFFGYLLAPGDSNDTSS